MVKCKNCKKRASFAKIGEKPIFCFTHKFDDMINVTKKICNQIGCEKQIQGKADKCKKHGGGKRCNEYSCKSSAEDNITGKCKNHGGGKRCNEPNCKSSSQSVIGKCKKHGGNKYCNEISCDKYVFLQDKCFKHSVNKCIEKSCETPARYGYSKCKKHGGDKRCNKAYCTSSAQSGYDKCMLHGGGKRCPNCIDWIDSRGGTSKYDGYCATCFKQIFPHDERSKVIYSHTKEIRVRNVINENFEGFVHDKPIYTANCDCTHRRRIDHRKLINNTILAVETDEFGHRNYDKKDEEIRYDDLYMIHSGKWIFIRFNPDCDKVDIEDKLEKLVNTIKEQIERIENEKNIELLEIIKLYY